MGRERTFGLGAIPDGEGVPADRQPLASLSPVELARRMGFEPDEKQALVLTSTATQGILNCSRQWGKSTVAAALAVCTMVRKPGCLVVVTSPSKRQSALLVRTVAQMVARLGLRGKKDPAFEVSVVLPTGSWIVGLPGREATVRGLARASLVLIDEAARVPDEMYYAVLPMLAIEQGSIWLMSTPWFAQGFFYEEWAQGGPEWERISVKATECPRISPEWLEKQRARGGPERFRREYMAEFIQDDASAFDAEMVDSAMDAGIAPFELAIPEFRRKKGRLGP